MDTRRVSEFHLNELPYSNEGAPWCELSYSYEGAPWCAVGEFEVLVPTAIFRRDCETG